MADKKVELIVGDEYQDDCCTVRLDKITNGIVYYTVISCCIDPRVIGAKGDFSVARANTWKPLIDPFDKFVRNVRKKHGRSKRKVL